MSPSWCDNGLSEAFYILAKVPLTGMTSPKRDDTDHLTVDSCCWQTRSEAQLVHSCPLWPDLILTFPELLLKPCYSWPQRMREEMGEGLLLTSRSWASPNPCPWTKSTPPPLFLCLGHASPPSFHAAPAYTALEIPGSRNNDLFPENTGQHLYPGYV